MSHTVRLIWFTYFVVCKLFHDDNIYLIHSMAAYKLLYKNGYLQVIIGLDKMRMRFIQYSLIEIDSWSTYKHLLGHIYVT